MNTIETQGIPLNEDETIKLFVEPSQTTGKTIYTFKENSATISEYIDEMPVKLSPQGKIAKEIKKYLDPHRLYKTSKINQDFDKIKRISQNQYETIKINNEELLEVERIEEERKLRKCLEVAKEQLESCGQPLLYIGSLIEWQTAGERSNILLSFVAYASQVILRNPISVIGLGEGASGKTHIQEVALSLIPDEFIVNEKKITESAMFNRAKEYPYFYDGKIVNYGDLGGFKDQEFIIESKNMLKELQSEGYLNKPLSVPDSENNWVTRDLTLYGKPCLTYTSIPNYDFDDQEKSRSIFITPRMDNKDVFNSMKSALELRGITYRQMKEFKKESRIVKYMVLHLRQVMEDVKIVNPYVSIIIEFLKESEYFKRDFDKYNGLLKTISALNYYNKTVHEINNEKIIYTSLEDVQLFFSLLKPYHDTIQFNISPKASEVLTELRENINDWEVFYNNLDDGGILTADYHEKSKLHLSKRSIQKYFKELSNEGYIKVVGSKGKNAPIWSLTALEKKKIEELLELSESDKENIIYELGNDTHDIIRDDECLDGLDIFMTYDDLPVPKWNKEDKEKYRIIKNYGVNGLKRTLRT